VLTIKKCAGCANYVMFAPQLLIKTPDWISERPPRWRSFCFRVRHLIMSAIGTKRTSLTQRSMSAFKGKPDIAQTDRDVR
jgi:hypothetical protein